MLKSTSILHVVQHLALRLGQNAFQVVDHWEADLTAIGIASVSDEHRLVYIFCHGQDEQIYDGFLERRPKARSLLPFELCGAFSNVTLDELSQIVFEHLCIGA